MLTDNGEAIDPRRVEVVELLARADRVFIEEGEHMSDLLTRLAQVIEGHADAGTSHRVLDEIVAQAPRLDADVAVLHRDHEELPALFRELQKRLSQLRVDAAIALDRLIEHHRLADHLVYEAFVTDLGGDG